MKNKPKHTLCSGIIIALIVVSALSVTYGIVSKKRAVTKLLHEQSVAKTNETFGAAINSLGQGWVGDADWFPKPAPDIDSPNTWSTIEFGLSTNGAVVWRKITPQGGWIVTYGH